MNTPPPLRPGSLLAIAAPASPFDREELFRGLAWLRTRYRLQIDRRVFAREGFLAGDDDTRAEILARAMVDPAVEAVVAARGGYGVMRIVDRLPWRELAARPKHILGFSDITALHVVASAHGVATVHGPNVTGLGRSIGADERLSVLSALEGGPPPVWERLRAIHPGEAVGPVFGGNLALVVALAAANLLAVPRGAIVVLEDVTERPYRVDRMLTSLVLGGHLAHASAIVFGGFTQCDAGPDGVVVDDVLAERTSRLGIPVYADAPFGHGAPNMAFPLGRDASLAGGALRFSRSA